MYGEVEYMYIENIDTTVPIGELRVLAFATEFETPVIEGEKTETIRYNLEYVPDQGEYLIGTTGDTAMLLSVTSVDQCNVSELPSISFTGHKNYSSAEEALEHLRNYYDDPELTVSSDVLILEFTYHTLLDPLQIPQF